MVQRPARHPGGAHDRLGAHAGKPVLGELRPRDLHQCVARGRGPVALRSALDSHTDCMYVSADTHSSYRESPAPGGAVPIVEVPQGRTSAIEYRVAGPEQSDAPPVVFVHGLLVDAQLWTGVADRLAAAGIRSYAPTCRSARTGSRSARTPT